MADTLSLKLAGCAIANGWRVTAGIEPQWGRHEVLYFSKGARTGVTVIVHLTRSGKGIRTAYRDEPALVCPAVRDSTLTGVRRWLETELHEGLLHPCRTHGAAVDFNCDECLANFCRDCAVQLTYLNSQIGHDTCDACLDKNEEQEAADADD